VLASEGVDTDVVAVDAELSVRCWQRGLRVVCGPEAMLVHHYEFNRNLRK
jgi:hypothetical protein